MGKLLATWVLSAISVLITASLLPGITVAGFWGAMKAAVFIGISYSLFRPILQLVTLPITLLTLGFFLLIVNALSLSIASAFSGEAFQIEGFGWAFIGAIILAVVNTVLSNLFNDDDIAEE